VARVNVPVFLIGLLTAVAGATGLVIWARLAGFGAPPPDSVALGFDAAGEFGAREAEQLEPADELVAPTTIGHRLLSLGGIVAFVAVVSAALALAIFLVGHVAVRMLEQFVQTTPTPSP
jgi:hypothetical protein